MGRPRAQVVPRCREDCDEGATSARLRRKVGRRRRDIIGHTPMQTGGATIPRSSSAPGCSLPGESSHQIGQIDLSRQWHPCSATVGAVPRLVRFPMLGAHISLMNSSSVSEVGDAASRLRTAIFDRRVVVGGTASRARRAESR